MSSMNVKRKAINYVLLTYGFTWAFTIPLVLLYRFKFNQEFSPWLILFLPGAYGPSIIALITRYKEGGRAAMLSLLRRLLEWKLNWKWYLSLLLLPLAWVVLAYVIATGNPAVLLDINWLEVIKMLPLFLLLALPFGPLAEELGWRGYLLPLLQSKYSAIVSSILIGVVWTFWHTPMFWFPGAAIPSCLDLGVESMLLYLIQVVSLSILMTVVFNRSSSSVVLAVYFHMTFNASENIIFSGADAMSVELEQNIYYITVALMTLLAILSIILFMKKKDV